MPSAAQFFAKVLASDGSSVRQTIDRSKITNVPRIVREVGKPAGEVTLELAMPWDDFSYGTNINLFDLVKVYAVNEDNPSGVIVYQGHITEILSEVSADRDYVALRLFPIDALLNNAHYKDGASESLADYTVPFTTTDVDAMFSAIITNANMVYGSFFSSSLANPALSFNIDFVELTHLQALQKAASLLDDTWYWRINASGEVKLAQWSATATHTLTLGKDVEKITVQNSIVDVKNGILLKWGGTPTRAYYDDATSETAYGKRQMFISDSGITNATTADARGDGDIARLKDPFTKVSIVANYRYPIETILAGDTVKVLNITSGGSQMVSGIMKIVRVEYDGATAILTVADMISNFGTEFSRAIT